MLSNALSLFASSEGAFGSILSSTRAATSSPAADAASVPVELYGLLAVGVVLDFVLLAWFIRRFVVRPDDKFGLANTPGRTSNLNPAHVLFVLAAWWGGAMGLAVLVPSSLSESQHMLVMGLGGSALLLCASLLIGVWCFDRGLLNGMGLSPRRWMRDLMRGVVACLAILPPCFVMLVVGYRFLPVAKHPILDSIGDLTTPWIALSVFIVVVMAPLAEEAFFRGVIQSLLRRYRVSPMLTVILAAAFFAAVHADTQAHAVPALFVLGIALGHNYERTGRLLPSIVLHAAFNAVFIGVEILRAQ